LQIFGRVLVVERPGKGRIGQDQGVFLHLGGVILCQRVAIDNVRLLDTVQEQVHAADAQHGGVEVEAVEEIGVEVFALFGIMEEVGVMPAQRLAHGYQKSSRAAGRVADHILGRGLSQLDHQLNNVARCAKLAILSGGSDLREHVLVEIALGVAANHGKRRNQINHLDQQRRRRNGEAGILHVLSVGRTVAAQGAEKRKDMLADKIVQLPRLKILEPGPTEVGVAAAFGVFAFGKEAPLDGRTQRLGLLLFERLEFVQAAQKEQVGNLLDHLKRVCDAAGPKSVPKAVNLIA
jgi:hypothetical protein